MTDADRILAARALVAEIAHALDCAEGAMAQGHVALREAAVKDFLDTHHHDDVTCRS